MIWGAWTAFAVTRVVPARKSFPIARKASFNETARNICGVDETLSDNTLSVCWFRSSVARGTGAHLDAPHPLAFDKSPQRRSRRAIAGAFPFGSVNAAQTNTRARAAVGAKLDIVAIYYGSHLAGKLGSIASWSGDSPKNGKYNDLQKR